MSIKVSGTLKWYLTTGSHIVKKVESKQNITLEDATILALRQELFEGKAEDDFRVEIAFNANFAGGALL